MTRYEYLKNATLEEMADVLCNITDNTGTWDEDSEDRCGRCLAYKHCFQKHTGFIDWLNAKAEILPNTKMLQVYEWEGK